MWQSLHLLNNYHSLAAVAGGIQSSGHAVDKQHRFITNPHGNYETYRRMITVQRRQVAMHYVFPIMRAIQSGEHRKKNIQKELQEAGKPEIQQKLRMELANLEENNIAGTVVLASKFYVVKDHQSWLPPFVSLLPPCFGY
ncbi:hypothetical protein E8E15_000914 [Penicillium rubens]|nr:hypothetical protein E8E15_000914 [Penicillium rubens]KAJ5993084.1 hypothetical protein N7451_008808 [Penicillium sp. IBT 35674x]